MSRRPSPRRAEAAAQGGPDGPDPALGAQLRALVAGTDLAARRAADPVAFAHRYAAPADREIAALIASALAFGRVAAFRPVLERLFAVADRHGGPAAWVRTPTAAWAASVRPLGYRWTRGEDLVTFVAGLGRAAEGQPSLEALLPPDGDLADALAAFVDALRAGAVAAHPTAERFDALPRGVRMLLPSPRDGSATKRWWMFLRWMVRPADDGIDLGLWRSRRPSELVIPLDTHVARIARFVGLTRRADGSLRTARAITAALAAFDRDDPVRFDFALAHLGIAGDCRGRRDDAVCPRCPLHGVCAVGRPAPGEGPGPGRQRGTRVDTPRRSGRS